MPDTEVERTIDVEELWIPVGLRAVFGGQIIGLALKAATRTIDDKFHVHSLHCYFLLPGDHKIPIIFRVAEDRTGRSYATRSVTATQKGKTIFSMMASFTIPETSLLQFQIKMPAVPSPHEFKSTEEQMRELLDNPKAKFFHDSIRMRLQQSDLGKLNTYPTMDRYNRAYSALNKVFESKGFVSKGTFVENHPVSELAKEITCSAKQYEALARRWEIIKELRIKGDLAGKLDETYFCWEEDFDLKKYASAAKFGKGSETVYDEKVRKAFDIPAQDCEIEYDKVELSILLAAVQRLAPLGKKLVAKFYKIHIYEKGGHFGKHRDTLHSTDHYATLIVPFWRSYFTGGAFILDIDGHEVNINSAQSVCFLTDVFHRIEPVKKGTRVTMQFDLYIKDVDDSVEGFLDFAENTEETDDDDTSGDNYEIVPFYQKRGYSRKYRKQDIEESKYKLIDALKKDRIDNPSAEISILLTHKYSRVANEQHLKAGDLVLYKTIADQFEVNLGYFVNSCFTDYEGKYEPAGSNVFHVSTFSDVGNLVNYVERTAVGNREITNGYEDRNVEHGEGKYTARVFSAGNAEFQCIKETGFIEHTGNESQVGENVYVSLVLNVGPQKRPIQRATTAFSRQQTRHINVFAEFAKSVKRQVEENKDFQKDVKMLSAETEKVTESEAMKNAKKAVSATSEATAKVIGAVGTAVEATMNNPVIKATGQAISKTAETVAEVTHKVADPIMETKAAKTVAKGVDSIKKDVVGIAGNAYFAEYKPKEIREKEKEELLAKRKAVNPTDEFGIPRVEGPIEENEEASGVVLHKSSKFNETWEKFKQDSPIAQKLFSFSKSMEENDSAVLRFWRNLKEKTVMEESETVKVIKAIRSVDPTFNQSEFLQETAHFVVPDLLDAYLKADEAVLQEWLTEAAFAGISFGFKAQKEAGLISDCKLVDYRNCEIEKMMMLEEEIPIIVVKFSTTEILLFRNKKGDIALGAEDKLQTARYIAAFTKTKLINPEAEYNPNTNGWTIVQWHRAA
ncbi:protein translocase subunit [Terramyces sp. JEL0728]|nr:protein translocase subunit [Terramyces sp. JEL0728]